MKYQGEFSEKDIESWALRSLLPHGLVLEANPDVFKHLFMQKQGIYFLIHNDDKAAYHETFK